MSNARIGRLGWLVIAYVAGLLVGWYVPYRLGLWAPLGVAISIAALQVLDAVRPFRIERCRWMVLGVAILFLGWYRLSAELLPPEGALRLPRAGRESGQNLILTGTVVGEPERGDGVLYLLVSPNLEGWSHGLVRLTLRGVEEGVRPGARISVPCKISAPRMGLNPGDSSSTRYWASRGVFALGWASGPVVVAGSETRQFRGLGGLSGSLRYWVGSLRSSLLRRLAGSPPITEEGLLRAVTFGDTSGMSAAQRWSFQRAGLAHLTSVSGVHISLVAGTLYVLLTKCRAPGPIPHLVALATAAAYCALVGPKPPIVRSLIMFGAAVAADLVHRRRSSRRALGLAAIAILLVTPAALFDVSFQLSFVATLGVVCMASRLRPWLQTARLPILVRSLATGLAVSVAAQTATLPFVAWYFTGVPLYGALSNMLAIPCSAVLLQGGLIGVFLAGWCRWGSQAVLCVAGWSAWLLDRSASWVAGLPGGYPVISRSSVFLIALLPFVCWSILTLAHRAAALRVKWVCFALVCGLVFGAVVWRLWFNLTDRTLCVTFLAVGEGAAVDIRLPGSRHIVVDTGRGSGSALSTTGDGVVAPCLRRQGVNRLDGIILTHAHADHMGGLTGMIPLVRSEWLAADAATLSGARQSMRKAGLQRSTGQAYPGWDREVVIEESGTIIAYRGVKVTVRGPVNDGAGAWQSRGVADPNERSLGVLVEYGQFRLLVTGDCDPVPDLYQGGVTVLQVPHHGSRTACSAAVLSVARPQVAVIPVGPNGFGHPSVETLARLADAKARVYRTDRDGAVAVSTDGKRFAVQTFARCDPYWR